MKPISKQPNSSITLDEIELRVVKEFLDVTMLFTLKENNGLSGYDLAVLQNQKFKISLSPGTVYATLYGMERRGLIVGNLFGKKTTYSLTSKGEETLNTLKKGKGKLIDFINSVCPILEIHE